MKTPLLVLAIGLAAACSDGGDGGDGDDGAAVDAAPNGLAAAEVTCPAQPAATVITDGFAYSPASTRVAVGGVVAFTMPSSHDAASDDGLFSAAFNATTCVRFDAPGTYRYHCSPHRFEGEIVVE
jgi:plastocyanin